MKGVPLQERKHNSGFNFTIKMHLKYHLLWENDRFSNATQNILVNPQQLWLNNIISSYPLQNLSEIDAFWDANCNQNNRSHIDNETENSSVHSIFPFTNVKHTNI